MQRLDDLSLYLQNLSVFDSSFCRSYNSIFLSNADLLLADLPISFCARIAINAGPLKIQIL